ncbi:MAG: GAF domain-containing protein [Abitibacteriaceae bacterium]|nr:GAF domain-containing protein [Abditibacteriaceae bacterium]
MSGSESIPPASAAEGADSPAKPSSAAAANPTPDAFAGLFLASPLSTQVFSPDGVHQVGNRAWQEFWHTTADAWRGYNILEDQQLAAKGLLPILKRGFSGEAATISPILYDPAQSGRRGQARWVQTFIHPLRDEDNNLHGVVLIHQDLTELKRSEDMLRFLTGVSTAVTSSLQYEAVLQNLTRLAVPYMADTCFVTLVEANGYFRRPAASYDGPQKEELANTLEQRCDIRLESLYGVPQVVRTAQPRLISEISDTLLEAATRRVEELQMLQELGVNSFMCVPMIAHNRTLGAITFVTTESRRHYNEADLAMAEELARRAALAVDNARLYEEAQEANRAKDEFLILAAHELRTPLTVLLGYAHLLKNDKLDAESRKTSIETVERNAWALVQVVNDIVDISRMNAGKVLIDLRPLTLTPIIEAAVENIQSAAESKAIRLEVTIDPGVGIVSGDSNRLQQVVWQLLSNAIKFTPVGGHIELHVTSTVTHARIMVTDNGVGISPQFLPHIFERFRQQDSTLTRSFKGLGMGLAIVRYLVEMHGGMVYATSAGEGEGATFTVELPMVVALTREAGDQTRHRKFVLDETLSLDGLRILAVEDQLDAREIITAGLTRYGALVRSSATANEALNVLSEWNPHVLVSDMALPGEDGYALIRKVRSLDPEQGGKIPAIAVTSHMRTVDRLRSLSAGYQAHLAKPIEAPDLAAAVASLTGRITQNN